MAKLTKRQKAIAEKVEAGKLPRLTSPELLLSAVMHEAIEPRVD